MSSRFIAIAAALLVTAAVAAPAGAQEGNLIPVPVAEVAVGYTFMRDLNDFHDWNGTNFPAGWYTSGAMNLTRWMGVVGEASGSYKNNLFNQTLEGVNAKADGRVYTFLGGPRFFYKRGRIAPHLQMLVGATHFRVNGQVSYATLTATHTETSTNFTLQPGGGVTIYLTPSIGARVTADFRTAMQFEGPGTDYNHQLRLASGLTFNWGRR